MQYCEMCGNNQTEEVICDPCREVIATIPEAEQKFTEFFEQFGVCCFGLSTTDPNNPYLWAHCEDFTYTYPEEGEIPEDLQVTVETKVRFYGKFARTCWTFDNDVDCYDNHYGMDLPYDPAFPWSIEMDWWVRLVSQLSEAAENAWNDDVLTCKHCGTHYTNQENHPDECPARDDEGPDPTPFVTEDEPEYGYPI